MTDGLLNLNTIKELMVRQIINLCTLLTLCFLFASCENDLKDVEKISKKISEIPVDKSIGVEVIYSDSAKVKAKLITPELLHFKTEKPYYEMKKGIIVIFYDENRKESSRVTADYAIRRENEKVTELKKNVVATNAKGETFKSEELIWDEFKNQFSSNQMVSITSPNGDVLYGSGFTANQNFSPYRVRQATGNMTIPKGQGVN